MSGSQLQRKTLPTQINVSVKAAAPPASIAPQQSASTGAPLPVKVPIQKRARPLNGAQTQTTAPQTSVDNPSRASSAVGAEKTPDTLQNSTEQGTSTTPQNRRSAMPHHEKGHKVHKIAEVWNLMDTQSYLRLTDTLILNDVWMLPWTITGSTNTTVDVAMYQVIFGAHIKQRLTTVKMTVDDLLQVLYNVDMVVADFNGSEKTDYETWINTKSSECVAERGIDQGANYAAIASFIMETGNFTFKLPAQSGNYYVFFRKVCRHSFPAGEEYAKYINPAITKREAVKGKFEYSLEVAIKSLPGEWEYDILKAEGREDEMVPESQPLPQ